MLPGLLFHSWRDNLLHDTLSINRRPKHLIDRDRLAIFIDEFIEQ